MKKLNFGNVINTIITTVSIILIMIVVLFFNKPKQVEVTIGEAAPETIYAPRDFVDKTATEQKKQEARDKVPNQFSPDETITTKSLSILSDFLTTAEKCRKNDNILDGADKLGKVVDKDTVSVILKASDSQFKEIKKVYAIAQNEMQAGVLNSSDSQKKCDEEIDKLKLSSEQKDAAKTIIALGLAENMVLDEAKTNEMKNKEEASVEEVVYKKNQTIVTKGEIVKQAHYDILHGLGLIKGTTQLSGSYVFGRILLMLVCFVIITFYFARHEKKSPVEVPISACCALLVILISFYGSKFIPDDMLSVLPLGLFVGIVTIFSCSQTAITTNLVLSSFCAIAFNADWKYAICLIIAGTMSAYCFSAVKRRSHLLPASIVSSVFYGLVFCAFSLIETTGFVEAFLSFVKGFSGGFLSGLITIGSLPLVEWIFNATTPMKLSELANPENKLLKKLLVEAPGTYHHSLTVANISEIAARSIRADALLTRVGAYYHDIGKLCGPIYFKENQYGENPHDDLSPEESSQLIIGHVNEGVELAAKHRLPQRIIDIIAEHHGTTTTGYFLIRAKEINPEIDESFFTYPGPAPQSKEAAIVMLADSCEAAVRSIEDKTEAKIEAMVRRIATDRVNSGQFSHCNLTFQELEKIIKVITKTLGGYFHERIKYE